MARLMIDEVPGILADDPGTPYVGVGDRYVVVYAVSYDHDCDPTDTGERVASPRDAAHWALELTRDGSSGDTSWSVFDTKTRTWSTFCQAEIEEQEA